MASSVTVGIVLGIIFCLLYFVRNRHDINNENSFGPFYFSFMYAAGTVLGLCTIYYAITGNCPLDMTLDNLRLPISIGGFMLLFESVRSQYRLLFYEN